MEIGDLYTFVLTLVLVGMILGVGLLVLGKFSTTAGITDDASEGINDTITAIKGIATTWMALIVTIVVLSIILTLVIRSFAVRNR